MSGPDRDAAEAYVRLSLALAERDPDSLDAYFGPTEWRTDAQARHESLADVQRGARGWLAKLEGSVVAERDDPARGFLVRQLRALAARADLVAGVHRSFAEESRLLFGVVAPAVDRDRITAVRQNLDRLLPGRGDLGRRLATFERRFLVPPDRLRAVLARAVDECRRATLQHIALPSDERLEIASVSELPWTALTRYDGGHKSRLIVNASAGFTLDEALQLACHEAYPGHHTINVLVDDALVRAAQRTELTVQMRFSPQALLAEGAASIAPQLAFPDADRLRIERTVLASVAGIDAKDADLAIRVTKLVDELAAVRSDVAVRYVDGDLEFARAAAALERDALMAEPDPLLKFLNEFRTYSVTYVRGPELAAAYLHAHAAPDDRAGRWRAYAQLVTSPSQAFEK